MNTGPLSSKVVACTITLLHRVTQLALICSSPTHKTCDLIDRLLTITEELTTIIEREHGRVI